MFELLLFVRFKHRTTENFDKFTKVGFINRMIKQSHVNNHLSKNVKFTAARGKD